MVRAAFCIPYAQHDRGRFYWLGNDIDLDPGKPSLCWLPVFGAVDLLDAHQLGIPSVVEWRRRNGWSVMLR